MQTNTLWDKKNYLLDIQYLIATNITEYDIRKANISVLYSEGVIDKSYYEYLYKADRMTRQIEIGYMIRDDKNISDILSKGIAKYRKLFFEKNQLTDMDILSIKNDAVFVIKKKPTNTVFGNIEFVQKNTYSSFAKLLKNEVYFKSDSINDCMNIDIKGISDEKLVLHQDYILSVIANVMYYIEVGDIKTGIDYITEFYNLYLSRSLPIGYYRGFNDESKYVIKAGLSYYTMDVCLDNMKHAIDIEYNLNIIRELYGLLVSIYLNRVK